MNEICFWSARGIARAVREKEVSALEVVETHLRRIEATHPALNAVVTLAADRAMDEARAADSRQAVGEPLGALHGVPVTIKDSIETAGIRTTGGTTGLGDHVPERDAPVVARLRAAGAIVLGKTNTPELTLGGESDNLIFGRTSNPYRLDRTPGGSSGGAAAIIAAGGAALDLGQRRGRQHPRARALLRHHRDQADQRARARHRAHPRELRGAGHLRTDRTDGPPG